MGVPGNVFQRRPLEVTSHVRAAGVRVLSFGIEDDHGLTQRLAVLTAGDVVELHRSLGAWLEEVTSAEREKLHAAQALEAVQSSVTVIEFRKRVLATVELCRVCGEVFAPNHVCTPGGAA